MPTAFGLFPGRREETKPGPSSSLAHSSLAHSSLARSLQVLEEAGSHCASKAPEASTSAAVTASLKNCMTSPEQPLYREKPSKPCQWKRSLHTGSLRMLKVRTAGPRQPYVFYSHTEIAEGFPFPMSNTRVSEGCFCFLLFDPNILQLLKPCSKDCILSNNFVA